MNMMNGTEWLRDAVFYNIYPQSFYDSNSDGIGDLKGITGKLDYVKDLGCNAIWMNPFYESPFRDAGYDVTDFCKVAERYGSNEDFRELCERAHSLGMKVCVDLVAGHTSLECKWFKDSCSARKNEFSDRYIWTNSIWDNPNDTFIGGYAERDGCYMKNFFYCQPALNYGFAKVEEEWQLPMDHPACRAAKDELLNIMDYWIGLGCDGFRVDMASSLIKNDADGNGSISFWKEIRDIFDRKYKDKVLIAEWSYPEKAIEAGFHIDFLIHFNLGAYTSLFRAEKGRNLTELFLGDSFFDQRAKGNINTFLKEYLVQYEKTKDKGYISIPTGNHDIQRISLGRTNEEIELVFAFVLTMPGVPFIYYGDEIGMKYLGGLPSKEGGYNRTGSRTPMQWNNRENAGFSGADREALYLPVDPDSQFQNVEEQLERQESLLNKVRELIKLRKGNAALCADGDIEFLNTEQSGYPLIYRRKKEDESFVVVINSTDNTVTHNIKLNIKEYLKNSLSMDYDSGKQTLTIKPLTYAIIKENLKYR